MDAIKGILAEYYWIFLIVGILVLVTLIGFISSVKKKAKEQQPQVAEANPEETQQPVAQPEMPQPTGATLDLTPVQSQQPYVEPSLDGLASSATEVKLGFDTNAQSSSIFENEGPMLVIEDHSAAQTQPVAVEPQPVVTQPQVVEPVAQPMEQEFGLVIEDPAAAQPAAQVVQPQPTPVVENEGPMLIIEDPSAPQTAPVQPVAVEPQPVVAQPQVVEPVAQPAVVQQQVVAQPAPMVQPEPAVQQAVAQVVPAQQPVPVAQPAPVQQPVQAVPVQTAPVQPQPVAQPMPAQQPVQQAASIFETDAPTLVIPDPSANQQQM